MSLSGRSDDLAKAEELIDEVAKLKAAIANMERRGEKVPADVEEHLSSIDDISREIKAGLWGPRLVQ